MCSYVSIVTPYVCDGLYATMRTYHAEGIRCSHNLNFIISPVYEQLVLAFLIMFGLVGQLAIGMPFAGPAIVAARHLHV